MNTFAVPPLPLVVKGKADDDRDGAQQQDRAFDVEDPLLGVQRDGVAVDGVSAFVDGKPKPDEAGDGDVDADMSRKHCEPDLLGRNVARATNLPSTDC